MKSKTSCFNKTIFLKNITHFWSIWVVILGWNLFILPVMIYNSSLQYKALNSFSEKELAQSRVNDILSLVFVYINPAVLFIFSVVAVMAVFSYLYQARSANAFHAFPVTRRELFITNYISGLLFLIVPEIIGFFMGILVSAVCGYTSMDHLLTGMILACGISFIFYSFTVFIAMFTGQLLAVPIFAVIINFLYVGCKTLVSLLMSMISYGMPLSFSDGMLDVLSPLFYITRSLDLKLDSSSDYSAYVGIEGKGIVGAYALAAVVFVVGAYLIYKIRDIETAGSLVSIPWICPIFRWGAAFCGGGLFSAIFCGILDFELSSAVFIVSLVFAVIFGIIFFFGAQMFLEKGFRVFQKKRIIECGAFLAVFICLYAAIEFDLFGMERKVPDVDQVEWAYMEGYYLIGGQEDDLVNQIVDLHQQIIESKKEFEDFAASSQDICYISFRYSLKNGTSLRREYRIPATEDVFADQTSVIRQIAELSASPEVYRKELFGIYDQELEARGGSIDLYDAGGEVDNYEFSKEDAEKIYQAVMADIEEGNFRNCIIRRYNYGVSPDPTFYNTIHLEYIGEKDIIPAYSFAYSSNYNGSKEGDAYIDFDANCKNVIAALVETGAIESETDLITVEEKYDLDESYYD